MKRVIIFFMCLLLVACAATKTNPTAAGYNTQLALAYLDEGKVERAKSKLLLALTQDPRNPLVLDAMGYFLEKTGEPKRAEKYYQRAITIAPNCGAAHNNYGTYLCRQKCYQAGIKHFLLAANNINYLHVAQAYENAGLCALKIPDKKLAKKYLTKALQHDPTKASIKHKLLEL